MRCGRCFRRCFLSNGQIGACKAVKGTAMDPIVRDPRVSTLSIGPVEEKSVYHYRPGSRVMTAGFYGCNLQCSFCLNHEISHQEGDGPFLGPDDLVSMALRERADGLAFSFSEPLLYAEYVRTAFNMAHAKGLYTLLRTSAMMSKWLFCLVMEETDACCIDIKGTPTDYLRSCGVCENDLDLLHENIDTARSKSNLELSVIVRNRDKDVHSTLMDLSGLVGPLVPVHLVSFIPAFKQSNLVAADQEDVSSARDVARIHFDHVYDESPLSETHCDECMRRLVRRNAGDVTYNVLRGNCCPCGHPLWKDLCAITTNAPNATPVSK